jgi:GNAT superfamily N-acetyltransferase
MKEISKSLNKPHITIREAKASDAAAIARVDFETYQTTYAGIVPQDFLNARTYEKRVSVWESRYSDASKLWNDWFTYVAEAKEGNVIGFAGGGLQHGNVQGYSGELGFIYLFKSHQRHGIGRQLTATIANRLKQQGHNSMLVWVFAQNPYRSFYEDLGGQPVSEKEVNYDGKNIKEIAYGWQDLSLFEKMLKPSNI